MVTAEHYRGTHALQVTHPQGSDGGWLTRFHMPGYDSVYVEAWFKLESTWQGDTKLISQAGSRIDNPWSAMGKAGVCPNGTDYFQTMVVTEPGSGSAGQTPPRRYYTYYPGMPKQSDGVTCWGSYGTGAGDASRASYTPDPFTLTAGAWHRVGFWVRINTVGQANTAQQYWVDGTLRASWSGFAVRTTTDLRLDSVTLTFSAATGAPQTQHLFVDDVLVSLQKPAQ